ncbi:hypothetical protein GCM10023084_05100 [Streptomyces lacrimifluminis]|uniref:Uncharacterized protein n=1 Tax=Streptomyces lacrimifluminis TaxID=1500077 RepID=A0A917NRD4_9ACTN|nr:hypothetical protein GCM10012282_18840 [Streptomyces lacrimifluminis]
MSGAPASGANASCPGEIRTDSLGAQGNTPCGAAVPFPVAVRPPIEDRRVTLVRGAFDLCKLPQACCDRRPGPTHLRPAPERSGPKTLTTAATAAPPTSSSA